MSEIAGTGHRTTATAVVHESYSFACMRCGHGWEQSYEIEHYRDADGNDFVVYTANGQRVPSPLSRPKCLNCGHRVVRIMRPGQVSSVRDTMERYHFPNQLVDNVEAERVEAAAERSIAAAREQRRWHLSDLLHIFRRKAD